MPSSRIGMRAMSAAASVTATAPSTTWKMPTSRSASVVFFAASISAMRAWYWR
jgi:hypothetical protein